MKPRIGPPSVKTEPSHSHPTGDVRARLLAISDALFQAYGPQHWWPAQGTFEMMAGAILTQAAAWSNVERALANLKVAGALSPAALRALPGAELARLVRPSGYFNAKARKLKALAEHLARYDDDLDRLLRQEPAALRQELLGIHGVGEETADSIVLYGARQPIFVIDAYTRRIMDRAGLRPAADTYQSWQAMFMENLPLDAALFNEYHALLVAHGKHVCRKQPCCPACPVEQLCDFGQWAASHRSPADQRARKL